MRRAPSQAKIIGTIITLGGAMIMTIVQGSVIGLPWTKPSSPQSDNDQQSHQNPVKGAMMVSAGCFCWSVFYILQAITLKSYPAGLSLTGLICMTGALLGTVLTFIVERGNLAIWSIGWDRKLLAYVYGVR